MYGPPYQQQRRHSALSVCPAEFGTYAALHLDTIKKIINHVLAIMLACNVFLFFSSWNVSLLPNIGLNTVFVSFLLSTQTICVWLIINNNRISALSFLAPTDFMVGVAFGITIGGTLLALVLSSAYKHVSACDGNVTGTGSNSSSSNSTVAPSSSTEPAKFGDPVYEFICQKHSGALKAVWFWSGLLFWFNFCACLLLAVGRQELSQDPSPNYEHTGTSSASAQSAAYEEQFRRSQAGLPAGDMMNQHAAAAAGGGGPAFVGDYSTIPEIRTGANSSSSNRSGPALVQQV